MRNSRSRRIGVKKPAILREIRHGRRQPMRKVGLVEPSYLMGSRDQINIRAQICWEDLVDSIVLEGPSARCRAAMEEWNISPFLPTPIQLGARENVVEFNYREKLCTTKRMLVVQLPASNMAWLNSAGCHKCSRSVKPWRSIGGRTTSSLSSLSCSVDRIGTLQNRWSSTQSPQ
jgi:hypothetical protein